MTRVKTASGCCCLSHFSPNGLDTVISYWLDTAVSYWLDTAVSYWLDTAVSYWLDSDQLLA